ncbi:DUF2946 family protein [Rhizobium herbae]|uniref:DUF2946 domain-containing protein n=1 Tax=Rhizobium herbae TaxID=508661 RepID=A0ABS4EG66_9HYPH|nr:DUF2946 family protein [Rhizobium herbae]MBP1856934.1 hypothetical protein [Rhizobium herbae]
MAKAGRHMQGAVRVLSALALLFLSFAHQPAFARQITPAMAAQYMLPDGSIDICFGLDGVDGHGSSHEGLAPVCDYCRLAASVLLPTPPGESYLVIRLAAFVSAKPDFHPLFISQPRTLPQSRAPPLSL